VVREQPFAPSRRKGDRLVTPGAGGRQGGFLPRRRCAKDVRGGHRASPRLGAQTERLRSLIGASQHCLTGSLSGRGRRPSGRHQPPLLRPHPQSGASPDARLMHRRTRVVCPRPPINHRSVSALRLSDPSVAQPPFACGRWPTREAGASPLPAASRALPAADPHLARIRCRARHQHIRGSPGPVRQFCIAKALGFTCRPTVRSSSDVF
jgi:hypothetical protein